jgi:predicted transcriptional regulator of viral defense system
MTNPDYGHHFLTGGPSVSATPRQQADAAIASIVADGRLHTSAEFTSVGIHPVYLAKALSEDRVVQYGRGIYFGSWDQATEHIDLAATALTYPGGVVCLGSAAQVHNLSNEDPQAIFYAVEKAKIRRQLKIAPSVPVRGVYWKARELEIGVEIRTIMGVDVRITNPARTVVDLLRYRHKLGDEPGTKALTDYLRDRHGSVNALWQITLELGCRTKVEPFLRFAEEVIEAIPPPGHAPGA